MRLRDLRTGLGLTVEDVGRRLLCSATKISRLETGARRASLRDVRDLCGIYEVSDEAQVAELMDLARLAREPGWWARFDEPVLSPLIGLEQEAVAVTAFSMYWVPVLRGLLARSVSGDCRRPVPLAFATRRAYTRLAITLGS